MTSTYINALRLNEMGTGDESGSWGTVTNLNLDMIGEAFGYGAEAIADASTHTITMADGAVDEVRNLYLKCTGGGQACTVTLAPNTVSKIWIIENATSYTLTFSQGSGANVVIPASDVKVIATDGAGSGAVVYDLFVDLNIATKLTVKNPATSASPATVLLQSGDTNIAAADVLGKIQFQAPDETEGTDAILVAAEIAAVSEGDFAADNNATKLSFKTGASEAATEKVTISSGGDMALVTDGAKISWGADSEIELTHYHDNGLYLKDTGDSPARLSLQTGNTSVADGDNIGEIRFQAPDEAAGTDAIVACASIRAQAADTFAADNNETELQFLTSTSGTRTVKMTIGHNGNTSFGNPDITGSGDEAGWKYHKSGRIYQSSPTGTGGLIMNDSGASGTYDYIIFRYNGTDIGDIDTLDNDVIRYRTFTGAHWSQFSDGSQASLKSGTVLSTVSDLITWTEFDYTDAEGQADIVRAAGHDYTIGDTYNIPVDERDGNTGDCVAKRKKTASRLPKCKVSDAAGDTAVYGVFAGHYKRGESTVEALGSGIILIGSGVSLNIGDLLESAGDGTARPQTGSDATVFKSSTIAKVTSTTKVDTHSDGSFTVPCTLHCG